MATYKVLQDIEAEDKILGPLTLKQFIFAIITVLLGFVTYLFIQINPLLGIPWLFPLSFFGFMASPIGRDQPNDVWLAARLRFLIKPRKRVWDQDGMQELVTITAPKKLEIQRTDGLSQGEVKSRLSALTNLMDTRGWAVKQAMGAPSNSFDFYNTQGTDRLLELTDSSPNMELDGIKPADDILDPLNNMIAQRIDQAIKKQHVDRIEALKLNLKASGDPSSKATSSSPAENVSSVDYSFINAIPPNINEGYATFGARVINPGAESEDDGFGIIENPAQDAGDSELLNKIHRDQELQKKIERSSHEHRIEPVHDDVEKGKKLNKQSTPQGAPDAILKQLGQANELSVSSLANLAKHAEEASSMNDDVVISLH